MAHEMCYCRFTVEISEHFYGICKCSLCWYELLHCNLGIDLADAAEIGVKLGEHEDVARRCKVIHDTLKFYQDAITSLEKVMCVYHVNILSYLI